MEERGRFSSVGRSIPRIEAREKVTGQAEYAPDLKMRGMLYGKLLRSPHPHARVTSIDLSRAKRHPRVKAVVTIFEVPKIVGYWWNLRTEKGLRKLFLRDDVVRFVGDPVLAVAAEDEEGAEEALGLISVEYEPLPAVFDPLEAMDSEVKIHEGGNVAFHVLKEYGDVEEGFRRADLILENTFRTSKQKHATLEPIGTCIADFDPASGHLTVYSSTQLPHWSQMYLAEALGLPYSKVRILRPHTGGAFGGRCGLIHGLELMCSHLSMKAGRPVRISFDREEDLSATEARHPFIVKLRTGVTKDGTLMANDIRVIMDVGGYGTHYIGVLADALSTGVGLYRIPHVRFEGWCVYTNTSLNGAFRGYGNPQINFALESQLDMIAVELGMDPVELRLKNYRGLGEVDPVFQEEIRSDGMKECLLRGAERLNWKEARTGKAGRGGRKRGVGMACLMHGTGARFGLPDPASAVVMVNADGSVTLVTAAADDGQGNRTVLAQIAAEELGVEFERVSLPPLDTSSAPLDGGTHASRQTYCGGIAVKRAAAQAKEALLGFAAKHLGADKEGLTIDRGIIYDRGNPQKCISLGALMRKIQIEDLALCQQIVGVSSGVAPSMPPTFGAYFAEVEVDEETGQIRILKLIGAFDMGRAINPLNVEGQIAGGAVMGMGWALNEGLMLKDGMVLNPNLLDYRVPTASDVPEIEAVMVESHEPTGPFGAKGIGEATMIGVAPAVANAIYHATGVRIKELPITPEKVLKALHDSRG